MSELMQMHAQYLAHTQMDMMIWLLLSRAMLCASLAVLFWVEPLRCVGDSRTIRRLLSITFAVAAWSGLDRAMARMEQVADRTFNLIPSADLVLSEMAMVAVLAVLMVTLGAEFFARREYKALDYDYDSHHRQG
jgi:hypothetical protein